MHAAPCAVPSAEGKREHLLSEARLCVGLTTCGNRSWGVPRGTTTVPVLSTRKLSDSAEKFGVGEHDKSLERPSDDPWKRQQTVWVTNLATAVSFRYGKLNLSHHHL